VLVPALGAKMPEALAARLARADVADAVALLQTWAHGGAALGAACTGTFVLAESALLDGQRATTSWWLAPMFRQRYPRIALDESRMLVNSAADWGRSGGAVAAPRADDSSRAELVVLAHERDVGKQHAELPPPGNRKRGCSAHPQWTGSTVIRQMAIQTLNTQKYRAFRRHAPGTGNQ